MLPTLTLGVGTICAAPIRSLAPRNSEPLQIINHSLHKLGTTPLAIQVFIPQDQRSDAVGGSLCRNPKCSRVAEVQQTGWGWGQPAAIAGKCRL